MLAAAVLSTSAHVSQSAVEAATLVMQSGIPVARIELMDVLQARACCQHRRTAAVCGAARVLLTIDAGRVGACWAVLEPAAGNTFPLDLQADAINKFSKTDLALAPTLFLEFHGGPNAVAEAATSAGAGLGTRALDYCGRDAKHWFVTAESASAISLWRCPRCRCDSDRLRQHRLDVGR